MNRIVVALGIVTLSVVALARQNSSFNPSLPEPKEIAPADKHEVLKGLKGVSLFVEPPNTEAEALGLTRNSVASAVQFALKRNGVPDLTREQSDQTLGSPTLYVNAQVFRTAYYFTISLAEDVRPERSPGTQIAGATIWSANYVGFHAKDERFIRKHIEEAVNSFCRDYLKANPKK